MCMPLPEQSDRAPTVTPRESRFWGAWFRDLVRLAVGAGPR